MGISISRNFSVADWGAERLMQAKKGLSVALSDIKTDIARQTELGTDAGGGTFRPYSKGYANWRKKKGYRVDPPNLRVTGSMMSSLDYEVIRDGWNLIGRIFFNSATQAAKAFHNQVELGRKFFELNPKREETIRQRIANALKGKYG
jgi:hypothetical protein